jgi:hypothetical protein
MLFKDEGNSNSSMALLQRNFCPIVVSCVMGLKSIIRQRVPHVRKGPSMQVALTNWERRSIHDLVPNGIH